MEMEHQYWVGLQIHQLIYVGTKWVLLGKASTEMMLSGVYFLEVGYLKKGWKVLPVVMRIFTYVTSSVS